MTGETRSHDPSDVDTWLQNMLAVASEKFPECGFFLLATVPLSGREEGVELSVASNLQKDEVETVLEGYMNPDTPTERVSHSKGAN